MKAVLVPGVLALLPHYASLTDPVADLRASCTAAVEWLLDGATGVRVLADEQGMSIARHLLGSVPLDPGADTVLVVGNGSARRSTVSPGPLDERALGFDDTLRVALCTPDPTALADLDPVLSDTLWARTGGIAALGTLLDGTESVTVDLDTAPVGVQWWVMRWTR